MGKKEKFSKFLSELILVLATIVMLVPIYYFVLGACKSRTDIIKFPLVINADIFTLDNFPYVIKKMKYWQALGNTALITVAALLIVILCASLAGFAISRIRSRLFTGYYGLLVTLMVLSLIHI